MASARNRGFNLRWQGESEERAPPWLRCTAFHLPSRARRRSERRIQRHFLLRRWHTCRLMNRGGNSIVRRIRNAPNWRRRGGGRGGGGGHVVLTPGSHWRNWRTPPPRGSSGRKTRPDENRGAGWRAGGQETEGTRGRFRAAGWKFQVRLPSPATSELLRSKSSEE